MSEPGERIGEVNNQLHRARSEAEAIEDPNVRRAVWSLAEAIDDLKDIVMDLERASERADA
jgi:hypothetical protein